MHLGQNGFINCNHLFAEAKQITGREGLGLKLIFQAEQIFTRASLTKTPALSLSEEGNSSRLSGPE